MKAWEDKPRNEAYLPTIKQELHIVYKLLII